MHHSSPGLLLLHAEVACLHLFLTWCVAELVKANELTFGFRFGGLLTHPLPPLEQMARNKAYSEARLQLVRKAADGLQSLQLLKQSGFHEEQEVRLIIATVLANNKNVQFRARGQDLVPYIRIEMQNLEPRFPIREVWIGPKNRTPVHLVEAALARAGFADVPVYRSATTYR